MIGASWNMFTNFYPSFLIGGIAGMWSTLSFHSFSSLYQKWKLVDTRGVQHLHGTLGIFGGITSAIAISAFPMTNFSNTIA